MTSDRPLPLPFVTPVAGISHRQEIACRVVVGASVVLTREPANPYDAHAIAIEIDDELLGYLPKALAARMRGTGPWRGEVTEVLSGQFIGVRVRVEDEAPGVRTPRQSRLDALSAPMTTTAPEPVEPVEVRALSGRVLGVLARRGDDLIVVRTETGEVGYPVHLVSIAAS